MASVMIEQDQTFLSHDVVFLFTNTPIDETLDFIKKQLEVDTKLKLRTNLNMDDIMELLKFIVTTTYFSFRGTIYQQKFGTAMGGPASSVITNLFMEGLEQQAIWHSNGRSGVTCNYKSLHGRAGTASYLAQQWSGVTCNYKSLHGMAGTACYSHSTNNLQTETMEEICG